MEQSLGERTRAAVFLRRRLRSLLQLQLRLQQPALAVFRQMSVIGARHVAVSVMRGPAMVALVMSIPSASRECVNGHL